MISTTYKCSSKTGSEREGMVGVGGWGRRWEGVGGAGAGRTESSLSRREGWRLPLVPTRHHLQGANCRRPHRGHASACRDLAQRDQYPPCNTVIKSGSLSLPSFPTQSTQHLSIAVAGLTQLLHKSKLNSRPS